MTQAPLSENGDAIGNIYLRKEHTMKHRFSTSYRVTTEGPLGIN